MHFSSFGTTINSDLIVNAIIHHGIPVFTHLRYILNHTFAGKVYAIWLTLLRSINDLRDSLLWDRDQGMDKRVHPKMAMEYLETYRETCEYFYLAANKFSKSTLELKDIGLFDLGRMKVIKDPGYLYPDVEFRSNLMKRIKNNFKVLGNAVDDPFQKTILEFY